MLCSIYISKIFHGLLEVRRLEFDAYSASPVHHRTINLGTDAHERRQDFLSRVGPQRHHAVDHVELQWMDVLLILLVPRLLERQHTVDADIVPEGAGVLSPYPMRVAVLDLVASPSAVLEDVHWRLTFACIFQETCRMSDMHLVLTLAAEHEEIVGGRDAAPRAVLDHGAVSQVLGHRPVADRERSEEHTSELQSPCNLVCRLLLEKKKKKP